MRTAWPPADADDGASACQGAAEAKFVDSHDGFLDMMVARKGSPCATLGMVAKYLCGKEQVLHVCAAVAMNQVGLT